MGTDTQFFQMQGNVVNPYTFKLGDGPSSPVQATFGQMGEQLSSELRGKYGTANKRGVCYTAAAIGLVIPVIAATLVSVFSVYNPVGSGVDLEVTDTNLINSTAATVVGGFGLYFSSVALSNLATFTTAGVVRSNYVGSPAGKGQFWTAATHSGTPILQKLFAGFGAVTSTVGLQPVEWDGKLIIPPGVLMSVANTKTAGGATTVDMDLSWIELQA